MIMPAKSSNKFVDINMCTCACVVKANFQNILIFRIAAKIAMETAPAAHVFAYFHAQVCYLYYSVLRQDPPQKQGQGEQGEPTYLLHNARHAWHILTLDDA